MSGTFGSAPWNCGSETVSHSGEPCGAPVVPISVSAHTRAIKRVHRSNQARVLRIIEGRAQRQARARLGASPSMPSATRRLCSQGQRICAYALHHELHTRPCSPSRRCIWDAAASWGRTCFYIRAEVSESLAHTRGRARPQRPPSDPLRWRCDEVP